MRALRQGADIVAAAATAYGQILFCQSAASGLILLLAMLVIAPCAGAMSTLACLVATISGRLLRLPAVAWHAGLYGYAGALTGLFWGGLFASSPRTWAVLLIAAAMAAPLTWLAHQLLTPRGVPTLALPALLLAWAGRLVLEPATATAAEQGHWALIEGVLVAGACAVYSRLLALAVVVGAAAGLVVSGWLAGAPNAGIIWNAVPTAAALGAVFFPWSRGSVALAGAGAAAAGALWWLAQARWIAAVLPPLIAPFCAVTIGVILAARSGMRRVPAMPPPLPLTRIATPEDAHADWRARRRLGELIAGAERICVLTGAGVSTAAGLPDVRGPGGLATRTRRVTLTDFIGSPQARAASWQEEETFFRLVRRAAPAAIHHALVELWRHGRLTAVITQNVDGLHQAAGLPDDVVIELHGAIREAVCLDCGRAIPRERLSPLVRLRPGALYCPSCQGLLKGGGTMFGEEVDPERLDAAFRAVLGAELLLVLGTSLVVSPASDVLAWARQLGIPVAIVNATETAGDAEAIVTLRDDVNVVVPAVLERALAGVPA